MVVPRFARQTVGFVDEYCEAYRELFNDVRSFECFKYLHVGLISELPRKSLPAIAQMVGLKDSQNLHHFLHQAVWETPRLRARRLRLVKSILGDTPIILVIDETGDRKKGNATDYVAKQYIGNLGKTANGIVSVNAYGVVGNITYPLLFKIFKPRSRLQEGDEYKTKPELAVELIREIQAAGFKVELVLADSFYGESSSFIDCLRQFEMPFIVAIRSNHGVLMPSWQQVRYNRWRAFEQPLAHHPAETRFIREIIFGQRHSRRYFQITKGSEQNTDSWYIMTDLPGDVLRLPLLYSLRNWIEYGFKQVKNELGWADFRLTDYPSIERWWEVIFCVYLMISLHAQHFCWHALMAQAGQEPRLTLEPFNQHQRWQTGTTWKSALNNLRLVIQPYVFYQLLKPWLAVFPIGGMHRCFARLIHCMNQFRASPHVLTLAS
ncbi:MAG TPA: IS701 family transposase [Leptolyngbyaceae cyanobacterium]